MTVAPVTVMIVVGAGKARGRREDVGGQGVGEAVEEAVGEVAGEDVGG
jgi:hypothetical protein